MRGIDVGDGSFRKAEFKGKPLQQPLRGAEHATPLEGIPTGEVGKPFHVPALDEHFKFEPLKRISNIYSPTGRHAELQYGVFSVQYDRETNNAVVVGRFIDGKRTIVDHDFGPVIEPFDGDLRHIGDEHVIIQNDEGLKRVTPDGTQPYTLQDDDTFMAEKSTYLGFSWGDTVTGRSIKEFINTDIGEQKNPKLGYIAGFIAKAEKDQILESTQVGDTKAANIPHLDAEVYERMVGEIAKIRENCVLETLEPNAQYKLPQTALVGEYYVPSVHSRVYLMTDVSNNRYGLVKETSEGDKYLVDPRTFSSLTPGVEKFESFGEDHLVARHRDARFAITTGEQVSGNPSGLHIIKERDITDQLSKGITGEKLRKWAQKDASQRHRKEPPKLAFSAGYSNRQNISITNLIPREDIEEGVLDGPVVETLLKAEQATQQEQARAVIGVLKSVASFIPRSEKMPDQASAIDALSIIAAHVIENPEHDGVIHDDIARMLDEAPERMTEETFRIAQGVIADRLDIIDNQLTTDTLTSYLERNKALLIAEQESKEIGAVKSTAIFTRGSDRLGFVYNRAVLALEDLNRGTKYAGVVAAVSGIDTAFDLLTNQSPVAAGAITGVAGLGATVYEVVIKRRDKNIRSEEEIDERPQPQEYSVARLEQPRRWVR